MNKNSVRIEGLNNENWYGCCQLAISKEQETFIESNAVSIAQSKFEVTLKPYAIYFENRIVGFLMYNTVPEELDGYWVYRIMVDKEYQGRGIGKAATQLMIAAMRDLPGIKNIVVGFNPENKGAKQLYSSLGFVDHGDRFGKEMAMVKTLG
ncbi:GNAT family N-acetyltransferase [Rossellomorea aquimaris]|uniref:GNAT family N-acetyltransferase n=1 Tax=Rossellomorea aquimaris TaxID=189382 RepID=UPI001CD7FB84|nr:GNAT family N-acetyltransferase [Rossellomorea aquimaris]MCA1054008.1 GNAT family N-acetyltransferase [Rossellomorea aquimaris]